MATTTVNISEVTQSIASKDWANRSGMVGWAEPETTGFSVTVGQFGVRQVTTWTDNDGDDWVEVILNGQEIGGSDFWPTRLCWVDDNFRFDKDTVKIITLPGGLWQPKISYFLSPSPGYLTIFQRNLGANSGLLYEAGQSYSPTIQDKDVDHYLNGLPRDANGYIVVTTTGAVDHYLNGLPRSAADSLCVEAAAVDHWSNGWPMTANNKVAIA